MVLILATGYFVAAEFAYVAVDRNRVQIDAAAGDRAARRVQRIVTRLSFHLSGAQLGITLTSLLLGFIAEPTVASVLEAALGRGASVAVALILVTVSSMIVSELVPKNVAIARAQGAAKILSRSMLVYGTLFGPLIRLLNRAANATVRRLGIEPQEELTSVRSLEELELLIRSSGEEGTLDEDALNLLNRALRFNEKTAADALVPRVQVSAVGPDDTVPELIERSVRTGFSRFPVCGADLDDVVGTVHVKDVYRLAPDRRRTAVVADVMTDPFIVPESRNLGSLLLDLRHGSHLAVVVDEYGGIAGIITLEDVLEEIVGDIDDEYDPAPPTLRTVLPAGTYELPGTLHPDEVREACGFEVPEGDYETLAGFVLDQLGRIPVEGDCFLHGSWQVQVLEMDRRRVATVRLSAPKGDGA